MTTQQAPRTIYEKIFEGDIPAYKIFEDSENGLLAFLDIFPATPGHTLVIPKEPVDPIYDLSAARYGQLALLTQVISLTIQKRLQPLRVTEHVYGFQVPHAHRMLVPSYVRGDVAFLNDPARMEQAVDKDALENMQDTLFFSPEETAKTQTYLRNMGQLLIDAT